VTTLHLPKYRRVADALRDQIRTGHFAPGDKLPSEVELIARFGYDRGTIRQAVGVLRREGLVEVEQGRGTFVRVRRRVRRNLAKSLWIEYEATVAETEPTEGLFKAMTGTAGDVEVPTDYSWAEATEDLADVFGVPEGAALLCRRYLHVIDGQPHQVTCSYLLGDMVEDTPLADVSSERIGLGTLAQLASIGVHVDQARIYLKTWLAGPEEVDALDMLEGQPVFGWRRILYAARRPVEVSDVAAPGEQIEHEIVVDFGDAP
jgi:GntR family transcriptional regulator